MSQTNTRTHTNKLSMFNMLKKFVKHGHAPTAPFSPLRFI